MQLQLITDAILTLSREGFRDAMQRTPASDWNASPSRERLLRVAWLSVPLSALVAVAVIMSGSASGALEAQGAAAAALLFALAAFVEMVLLPYMLQGLGFGVLEFGFFSVEGLGFLGSGFAFSAQQKMEISSSLPFFSLLHFFLAYMVASRLVSLPFFLPSISLPLSLPLNPSSQIQLAEPLYIMAHNLLLIHVRVRVEVRGLFLLGQSLSKNLAFRWLPHTLYDQVPVGQKWNHATRKAGFTGAGGCSDARSLDRPRHSKHPHARPDSGTRCSHSPRWRPSR